ncbi:uncharacterized protein KZ484_025424 [Pholidichthys leucotaenia]
MQGQSQSSFKYLFILLWCGLLTVAVVAMGVLLAVKLKSLEGEGSAMKLQTIAPKALTNLQSPGCSPSFIQLIKVKQSWEEEWTSRFSPFLHQNNSITLKKSLKKSSFYFIYAHVSYRKINRSKSVLLKKNGRRVAEGTIPSATGGSLWVAKIVELEEEDRVSIEIPEDAYEDHRRTYWGAYEIH